MRRLNHAPAVAKDSVAMTVTAGEAIVINPLF